MPKKNRTVVQSILVVGICLSILLTGPAAATTSIGADTAEVFSLNQQEGQYGDGDYEDEIEAEYGDGIGYEGEIEYGDSPIQSPEDFVGVLEGEFGLQVYDLQFQEDIGYLTIGSNSTGDIDILVQEILMVTATYTVYVDGAEAFPAALVVEIVDSNGDSVVGYHIEANWVLAYLNGSATEEELMESIFYTLQDLTQQYQ